MNDLPPMQIIRYSPDEASVWDAFVKRSVNGTFLFQRGYIDYHADRFSDHSLMVYRRGRLLALLPADASGQTLRSHGGLTFGGLIIDEKARTPDVIECFTTIRDYLLLEGFSELLYKAVPYIYTRIPAQADLYAIFRLFNSQKTVCNVASVIDMRHRPKCSELRRRCEKKAARNGVICSESDDYSSFWKLLSDNLQSRFGAAPVHSLSEILLLHGRFPHNIRLFTASLGSEMLAGAVIYESDMVAHCQYLSASPRGKKLGALDLLLENLITDTFNAKPYFDFGTSNEDSGHILNEGLIAQKEGFGGRPVTYDTYLLHL